ncbi:MAG: Lrp/AsnC family transcriptional regulator [Pseudomonadota bacterium]
MEEIDRFDRRILAAMEVDARQTGNQLSERIGLSPAACLRRLQRLRKIGAIEREIAVVSPKYQLQPLTQIIVMLTIARHNPKRIEELTRRLARFDEVQRIFSVTGDEDIVVLMGFPSMEAFSDFANRHFYEPPVEGFQSLVVLKEFKKDAILGDTGSPPG